jgi:transcriptional regulator with XRE-family HTH domain
VSTSKKALENLVERLAKARRKAELSQAALAKLLGKKHQSFVAKVEAGERKLDLEDFVRWARAVGEDPSDMLKVFEDDLDRPRRTAMHLK